MNGPPNGNATGETIGQLETAITVPEMTNDRSDEPLDLGTLTAKLYETLDQGKAAPEFAVEKFTGGTVRLSQFDCKLVLVNFWTSYSPAGIAGTA